MLEWASSLSAILQTMNHPIFFKNPVSKICYILCVGCLFPILGSGDEVIDLVPFEVTGSRIPSEGFRSDVGLLTINSDDLSASNPESLWETLETVSGLHIEQSAGLGGNASVYRTCAVVNRILQRY